MGDQEAVPAGVDTVVFATEVFGRNGRRVPEKKFDLDANGKAIKREKDDDDIILIKDESED